MGRPQTPSREQIAELRRAGMASPPERVAMKDGKIVVTVPARGLAVVVSEAAR